MTLESFIHDIEELLEFIGIGFDILGVLVICLGILLAFVRYFRREAQPDERRTPYPYRRLKIEIGLALLLGLEILVAADIIKTVAIEPTFDNVGVLGLLVIIRTFLSWTLVLEIEGRWPWQGDNETIVAAPEDSMGEILTAKEGAG